MEHLVAIPVFNEARYVDAVLSAVRQHTAEILVIDDGSTDGTAEVVGSFDDPRVRLLRNSENLGQARTRNRGIELARGEFIANLDSDDLAHARRLDKQVAYLDVHPECAVLGTWACRVSKKGRPMGLYQRPVGWNQIRAELLFHNCFKHTSVMARREVLLKFGYDPAYQVCQDVDLYRRIALTHPVANLPEPLSSYRKHKDSISRRMKGEKRLAQMRIAAVELGELGVEFDERDVRRHFLLREFKAPEFPPDLLDWTEAWLARLHEANRTASRYPEPEFSRVLGAKWWQACRVLAPSRPSALRRCLRSPLARRAAEDALLGARARLLDRPR